MDPRGITTYFHFDALNRAVCAEDARGGRTYFEYDANGNRTAVINPRGQPARLYYDSLNRPFCAEDALGGRSYFEYDANGNRTVVRDALGGVARAHFDALNRAVCAEDACGALTYLAYDAVGNVTSKMDPLGQAWISTYDDLNRPACAADPLSNSAYFFYDAVGNRSVASDQRGLPTYFHYDAANRLYCIQDAMGNLAYFVHDANGNRTAAKDALGRVADFHYDDANQLVCTADPLGDLTYFGYDAAGNRARLQDALGNVTAYSHDRLGRLESVTDPLGQAEYYAYDLNGNLRSFTNASLGVTQHEYDNLDRRTATGYPDGSSCYFGYDALSRMTAARDGRGWTYFGYDAVGRVVSELAPDSAQLRFSYDVAGRRTCLRCLGVDTYFSYDQANRLKYIGAKATAGYGRQPYGSSGYGAKDVSSAVVYVYDPAGNLTRKWLPNGCYTYFAYDQLNRLSTVRNCLPGGAALTYFDYSYDAVGRITRIDREGGVNTYYEYDDADRLTREKWLNAGFSHDYEYWYDAVGNRTAERRNAGTALYYSYDAANQLSSWVSIPAGDYEYFAYDARGNCTRIDDDSGLSTYFQYNSLNMVERIRYANGVVNRFWYDALGRRFAIEESTGLSYFTWDRNGLNLLAEHDATGNVTAYYTHGYSPVDGIGSCTVARRFTAGGTYFQYDLYDHRGSVIRRLNQYGNVVGYFEYDAWGNPLRDETSGASSRFAYQTNWMKLADSLDGLYLSLNRSFNPATGRFLQRDPQDALAGECIYCSNNPVDAVDADGQEEESVVEKLKRWSDSTTIEGLAQKWFAYGENQAREAGWHRLASVYGTTAEFIEGFRQGQANLLQGVQDSVVGLVEFEMKHGLSGKLQRTATKGMELYWRLKGDKDSRVKACLMRRMGDKTLIDMLRDKGVDLTADWAKGMYTYEDEFDHKASKFLGGEGMILFATMGAGAGGGAGRWGSMTLREAATAVKSGWSGFWQKGGTLVRGVPQRAGFGRRLLRNFWQDKVTGAQRAHHAIVPSRLLGEGSRLRGFVDAEWNLIRPARGASNAEWYAQHARLDPFFNATRGWRRPADLKPYGFPRILWEGSPTWLRGTALGLAGANLAVRGETWLDGMFSDEECECVLLEVGRR